MELIAVAMLLCLFSGLIFAQAVYRREMARLQAQADAFRQLADRLLEQIADTATALEDI